MQRWETRGITRRQFLGLAGAAIAAPGMFTGRALSRASITEPIRIGAVLPTPTGYPAITDAIGKAARTGAVMAEDLIGREADRTGMALQVLLANSPTADAAFRAAQRLVVTEGVSALIGGLGNDQAEALREVAEERKVLFFNIGSLRDSLRGGECSRYTFHVEASAAMYLDGLAGWFNHSSRRRWFIVYEGSEDGRALYHRAVKAVTGAPTEGTVIGMSEVAAGQRVHHEELDKIRTVGPDVVLLLLRPEDQEFFLGQYELAGLDSLVTGLPAPVTQTREFLRRFRQMAPKAGAGYRATLWETTLDENGAGEINDRFMSRVGAPMDPPGWAAYAAVKILYEAIAATGALESSDLIRYLESPQAIFDVHKGVGVSFRPWDHQLRQPLYLIKIDPEARWGIHLAEQMALAHLVGELPASYLPRSDPEARLDRLGDLREESACHF